MRLLTCSYCDPPSEFDDYVKWFTHKVLTGHHPESKETTTMSIENVGQATGAIAGITQSLGERNEIIGAGGTVLEDRAQWVGALARTLSSMISTTNAQTTEIEQDLIALAEVIQWLSVEITMASAAGRPTGRIEAALVSAQELDGHLRSAMTAISTLSEAVAPVQRGAEEIAAALVRLVGTSEALQRQISTVRHESDQTRALIAAISEE